MSLQRVPTARERRIRMPPVVHGDPEAVQSGDDQLRSDLWGCQVNTAGST